MQEDPNTDLENASTYVDPENWRIAFEPYEGKPEAALTLAFLLTELKQSIGELNMHDALDEIDVAIDCLYDHSDFRNVSRELFEKVIEGRVTKDKEALLRQLGIQF
jgi:hypothetical protein